MDSQAERRAKMAKLKRERAQQRDLVPESNNPYAIDMWIKPNENNNNNEVKMGDPNDFEPYPNAKIRMKLHTGEEREKLMQSIEDNGVIDPIIAMPSKNNRDKLTIIAGHNRVDICKALGIEVPYILKTKLSDEEADLICIDTNLFNRQHNNMLPSQLAWVLKRRNDIIKAQGKRSDIEEALPYSSSEEIGQKYKLSASSVKRHIRLCSLNEKLLEMVDEEKLPFRAAVDLSYLKSGEQDCLVKTLETYENYKIDLAIAEMLKKMSKKTPDSDVDVAQILENIYNPKKDRPINPKPRIKFKPKTLLKFEEQIREEDLDNVENIILEGIRLYYSNN